MRWLTNGSIISPSKPLLWEFEGFLGENMCLILSYISYLSRLVVRPTWSWISLKRFELLAWLAWLNFVWEANTVVLSFNYFVDAIKLLLAKCYEPWLTEDGTLCFALLLGDATYWYGDLSLFGTDACELTLIMLESLHTRRFPSCSSIGSMIMSSL